MYVQKVPNAAGTARGTSTSGWSPECALDKSILRDPPNRKAVAVNLIDLVRKFPTDDCCRQHLERIRWPHGVKCPKCDHDKITRLTTRKQFTCAKKSCRYRFSVTSGTIMHSSKIPLQKWFFAIAMLADAKKSISSLQMHRHLHISEECCWHMCHRIRAAMADDVMQADLFRGIVQADEYYFGGATRPEDAAISKNGRGAIRKHPIFGAYECETGRVRTSVVPNVKGQTLAEALQRMADMRETDLRTDEWQAYRRVGRECRSHRVVRHSKEYVTVDGIHTNHVESAWSLLARSVMGSFHHMTIKHLPRYLAEFDSRFNARFENGTYFERILRQSIGRRLTMDTLVNGDRGANAR
jgi:transposase-like protein